MMSRTAAVSPVSDRGFAIDAAAIGVISVAIAVSADRLAFMTALVPSVIAARFALWLALPRAERGSVRAELIFFAGCTALGAFNDWSSVVRHGIYDYGVPVYFPDATTIPVWMLLYWGLVLRFLATLFRWQRFDPSPAPRTGAWLLRTIERPLLRVAALLVLVVVTRQLIYRLYDHPVMSWLPFAVALVVYAVVFRPDRREQSFAALFAIGGPLVEIAYIQLGGLHHYHLGWLGGVPVWIALWWVLSALIWRDLSLRAQTYLSRRVA